VSCSSQTDAIAVQFIYPKPFLMKTRFLLLAVVFITGSMVLSLLNHADAKVTARPTAHAAGVDDTITNFKPSTGAKNLKLNDINISAMRDFIGRYKDLNSVTWYKEKGGFIAKFTSGEIATSVTYKINGEWLYTISAYSETAMPERVRGLVKSTYYDFNIVHIKEVRVPRKDNAIFLVYIQDATTIKELRIYNGEMEVLHDYVRG
jgi:hypothetical protein